jgi:hypothetical protein
VEVRRSDHGEDVVVTLPSDGSRVDDFYVESRVDGWYVIAKPLPMPRPALKAVR